MGNRYVDRVAIVTGGASGLGEATARLLAGEGGRVVIASGPGSHLVAGLAASDLLVIIPEEVTALNAGDDVETWAL